MLRSVERKDSKTPNSTENSDGSLLCNEKTHKEQNQSSTKPQEQTDGNIQTKEQYSNSCSDDDSEEGEADESERFMVQAVVRTGPILPGGTDGNLMRVLPNGSNKIGVDFRGTFDTRQTEQLLYLDKKNDADANALRYSEGNRRYYLCACRDDNANFCKLSHFPSKRKGKYLFHIKAANETGTQVTFDSKKTGEFLHCGLDGKAFFKTARVDEQGRPTDKETWFSLLHPESFQIQTLREERSVYMVGDVLKGKYNGSLN